GFESAASPTTKAFQVTADTEANCRAKMWLYLKKEGLIK
ncbi:hypothetical protein LCGC14_1325060, partial [marine sediment metagenome]